MSIEHNAIKGKTVLRFFGPNRKKESKIVVTKCKEENVECVTILAELVITKLVDANIDGKDWDSLKSTTKEIKPQVKCTLCEKVFNSEQYMKSHRTRVHKEHFFTCRVCEVMFKTEENLQAHVDRLHPKPQVRKRPT